MSVLKKPSLWAKTVVAAVLSVSLLTPTIHASADTGVALPKAKTLDSASATGFLDDFFAAEEAKPHYVGASVVIVKDGKVLAQKGYGFADKEKKTAVDPASTVFRVASVSKTFTATALMQLVEQGKVSLKDDFTKYVTGLTFDNPFNTPVTIGHLLTHTTGFQIQDVQQEDVHEDFDKVVELEDYVKANMPPVVREPGTSYLYDNFASTLAGLVVEKVSGVPFAEYMEKQVFEPLQMNNSGFLLEDKLKENLAVEYNAAGIVSPYAVNPTTWPAGGMLSTSEDIGKFMIAFLNGGAAGTNRILTESTVDSMEQYRSSIHPLLPDTTYGFEAPFQLPGAGSSPKIITKAGDLLGTSSYMFLIPEQNTGVFITYNQRGILRNFLYGQFISTFFPQYGAPVKLDPYVAQDEKELSKFNGYYSDLRLDVLVSALGTEGEGDLVITDVYMGTRPLKQVDDNLFVDSISNQFTAFKLDDKGNVSYMKEPYLNPMGYSKKGAVAVGFSDINKEHPYAKQILTLQSLGHIPNDATQSFNPEKSVTRAEYVKNLLELSNVKGSKTTELAFTDIKEHEAAAFIQMAVELGMVTGNGKGLFHPDKPITRQEAAVMMGRLLALQYPAELFESVQLSGKTDKWAIPAVKMLVALGLHGPEVQKDSKGAADFKSKQLLNRQEEAAIYFAMLTQPTDQIVAALKQEQEAKDKEKEKEAPKAA
ncbi:serine hydrolase [Paenibacillus sp. GSMTC-2017]|nr:serine hydrolase [Paenibacillus sp. GSMTC-2017]